MSVEVDKTPVTPGWVSDADRVLIYGGESATLGAGGTVSLPGGSDTGSDGGDDGDSGRRGSRGSAGGGGIRHDAFDLHKHGREAAAAPRRRTHGKNRTRANRTCCATAP